MKQITTSLTIVFKLVIPTLWITFFGLLTFGIYMIDQDFIGPFPVGYFRLGLTLFFLIGVGVLYWSVMRLKRVDADDKFIYVTNYFKTYRYPYHQIASARSRDYLLFRSIDLFLKQKGSFGERITFLPSKQRFEQFLKSEGQPIDRLLEIEAD